MFVGYSTSKPTRTQRQFNSSEKDTREQASCKEILTPFNSVISVLLQTINPRLSVPFNADWTTPEHVKHEQRPRFSSGGAGVGVDNPGHPWQREEDSGDGERCQQVCLTTIYDHSDR